MIYPFKPLYALLIISDNVILIKIFMIIKYTVYHNIIAIKKLHKSKLQLDAHVRT